MVTMWVAWIGVGYALHLHFSTLDGESATMAFFESLGSLIR